MKKRKPQKRIELTESKLNRLKEDITASATEQALLLVTAFCTEEYGLDDSGVVELWETLSRWCEALSDHTITLNTVKKIIEEQTETEIRRM